MANLSKIKRDQMLAFLESLKESHSDDASIQAFNEIENYIRDKKYGLVWEEHSEEVDDLLKENIPVLTTDPERRLCKDASLPWNFIIEGDNLQALYLLQKTHKGKVDCIYIDPPYNTGARDWKYNNDYVDDNDDYRHSKWLSMMKTRLSVAKDLLKPETGVLIVTIDEHEVHHLRALLEQQFPEYYIQMTTYVINPKGVTQGRFSRVEEYAIYCFGPKAFVSGSFDNLLNPIEVSRKPRWKGLLRSGTNSRREDRKNLFYPVYIDVANGKVAGTGETLPYEEMPSFDPVNGYQVAWPIRTDGSLGNWGVSYESLRKLIDLGYVKLGKYDKKRRTYGISYISIPNQRLIEEGKIIIVGRNERTGVVEIDYADANTRAIKTIWHRTLHDAGAYGTDLLSDIIGENRTFSFPKSIYATKDALSAVIRDNPNALVVDFFAGSGTTANAVNLLNAEDGGQRRFIIVTNNEVSEEEEKELKDKGLSPTDKEWNELGISHSVTWPRLFNTIMGHRENGDELTGTYFVNVTGESHTKRTFKKLDFITVNQLNTVAQKKQLVSLLGKNVLAQSSVSNDSKYIVSEKHSTSILFDDYAIEEWIDALNDQDHIKTFYIVTQNSKLFRKAKETITELLGDYCETSHQKLRPMNLGFEANVAYLKCEWTPRKPEDYLLSNVLCLHIKEMIELQNAIEVDNVKNVLILNKEDFKHTILNEDVRPHIERVWVNQNIIFSTEELKALKEIGYKYIPREFFGQELREAAE